MHSEFESGRKYRLVDKSRLYLVVTVAALLLATFAGFLIALGNKPVYAGEPAATTAARTQALTASPRPSADSNRSVDKDRSADWKLALVNATHLLSEGFRVETRELPNGQVVDERIYDDLVNMINDGQRQGLDFVVCSAFRSFSKQQELFDNKVSRIQQEEGKPHDVAYEEAQHTVALPGTSEHQLGLAVDIVAYKYQQLDDGQLNTPECAWLRENSWKYGFIMRYPENKKEITKIISEPWHYRYVGTEAARAMHESGQCLEEYLGVAD